MSAAGIAPPPFTLPPHTITYTHYTQSNATIRSQILLSLIIATAPMTQGGSRCFMEMKGEMQRIYNASQITDKAQRKQTFAWGLHHQGVWI